MRAGGSGGPIVVSEVPPHIEMDSALRTIQSQIRRSRRLASRVLIPSPTPTAPFPSLFREVGGPLALQVGAAASTGNHETYEDRGLLCLGHAEGSGDERLHAFAVLDGHGGHAIADAALLMLHSAIEHVCHNKLLTDKSDAQRHELITALFQLVDDTLRSFLWIPGRKTKGGAAVALVLIGARGGPPEPRTGVEQGTEDTP